MVKARKYVVKKYFAGLPKRDDYEIVEHELPPLKDGEILVKTEFISIDPSQRASHSQYPVPYDQSSYQVGVVEQSKSADYPVGCRVVNQKGWCDYSILDVTAIKDPSILTIESTFMYKLPDLKGLPISLAVGAIGMSGVTAYFGFLDICKPKAGETVVVTGAAGAVGSLVGQIAKIKGCRVIGFAGADDKVQWLEKDLGFDKALNYKTVDIAKALKEAAPKGVDCYFDNVGGEISSTIMSQMNDLGRVSVCGFVGAYNEVPNKTPKATILQPAILYKRLTITGLHYTTYVDRWFEALNQITDWIKDGKIVAREHVVEGFDKVFDAFVGVLVGENIGKSVIKV